MLVQPIINQQKFTGKLLCDHHSFFTDEQNKIIKTIKPELKQLVDTMEYGDFHIEKSGIAPRSDNSAKHVIFVTDFKNNGYTGIQRPQNNSAEEWLTLARDMIEQHKQSNTYQRLTNSPAGKIKRFLKNNLKLLK